MSAKTFSVFGLCLWLAACGGGGGGGSGGGAVNDGVFIDSAVQGVRYETATLSGFTSASGTFQYADGESVSFFIGDILLGRTAGAPQVTPIDFVPGAIDETHPQVTNILRFVQTLDEDGDPGNGIRITTLLYNQAAGMSVNFAQTVVAFENDGSVQIVVATLTSTLGAARTLIDAAAAQAHLRDVLNGGTGGTGGTFGSLTLTGADTGAIGTRFTPTAAAPTTATLVSFEQQINDGTSVLGIGTTPAGNLLSVTLFHAKTGTAYAYQIICLMAADCALITLDVPGKSVSFEGAAVPNTPGSANRATAPVTLSGTLTWN